MNWTGGRLFRHSFKDKRTTKAREKLHFAKARRSAHNSRKKALSPVRITRSSTAAIDVSEGKSQHLTGGEKSPYFERKAGYRGRTREQEERAFSKRPCASSSSQIDKCHRTSCRRPASSENLDEIRRKLLRKNDWAKLSVARPLNVHFTTEEERYHYGRRRPITKADQQRLAASEKRPAPIVPSRGLLASKRRKRRVEDDISTQPILDDISIRINAQKQVLNEPSIRSTSRVANQVSSDYMLLDQESDMVKPSSALANPRSSSTFDLFQLEDGVGYSWSLSEDGRQRERFIMDCTSGLPVLNRHGAFAVDKRRTRYIPPETEDITHLEAREKEPAAPVSGSSQGWRYNSSLFKSSPFFLKGAKDSENSEPQRRSSNEPLPEAKHIADRSQGPVFFGQRVAEAKDNADEIWKKLIFKPQEKKDGSSFGGFMNKERKYINDASSLDEIEDLGDIGEEYANSEVIQTTANTSLNCPISPEAYTELPSETDFLSRFSPMEGYIDEALGEMSVYNNAARTNNSIYLSSPEVFLRDRCFLRNLGKLDGQEIQGLSQPEGFHDDVNEANSNPKRPTNEYDQMRDSDIL